jgi:tetratricopeptide (TPR) repeat protein
MQDNGYVCITMSRIKLLLIIAFLLPGALLACINEYYRPVPPFNGEKLDYHTLLHSKDNVRPYWDHGFWNEDMMDNPFGKKKESLLKKGLNKLDYKELSDYAAIELRVGDRKKAVEILEKLYAQHPDEYNIVANLGTGYELTGNDAKALELLRKAVVINPQSHYSSEWIHVNILEQKVGAKQYDKIINLGVKDFSDWIIDKNYTFPQKASSLQLQIAYQLHERIGFIAPPDDIVGQLVLDFADIVAKNESYDAAIPFYEYAGHYSASLQKVVEDRKAVLKSEKKEIVKNFRWASVVWALPLIAFFMIFFAWIKTMRRQKQKSEVGDRR